MCVHIATYLALGMRANVLRVCAPHVYCGSRRVYVTKCGALLRVVSATRAAIPQRRQPEAREPLCVCVYGYYIEWRIRVRVQRVVADFATDCAQRPKRHMVSWWTRHSGGRQRARAGGSATHSYTPVD